MNGSFVTWDDARVHVLTHGLHYGTGIYEGMRCYKTSQGPGIFRPKEHYERLLGATRAFEKLGTWDLCQLLNHTPDEKRGMRWYALLVERLRDPGPRNEEGPGTE